MLIWNRDVSILPLRVAILCLLAWVAQPVWALATADADFVRVGELRGSGGFAVAVSGDGGKILTASRTEARVWNFGSKTPISGPMRHQGSEESLSAVEFSPDGARVLTVGWDGTARIWDSNTSTELVVFKASTSLWTGQFSPNGKEVAVGGTDRVVHLWDAASGQERHAVALEGAVKFVLFSPDGRRLLSISDRPHKATDPAWMPMNSACVWDAATGRKLLQVSACDSSFAHPASFSADGKLFATCDCEDVDVWNAATGRRTVTVHAWIIGGPTEVVRFSRDGSRLLTASVGGARLWNVQSGKKLIPDMKTALVAGSAVFSPDGRRILTAATRGQVVLWNASSGAREVTLQLPKRPVNPNDDSIPPDDIPAIAFSPDGQLILVGDPVTEDTTIWKIQWPTENGKRSRRN